MYMCIKVDYSAMRTLLNAKNVGPCNWEKRREREREREREGVGMVGIPWAHIMMHATSYTVFAKLNQRKLEINSQ